MIIKNEQEMLPKCLKSIKGVDEIIVVDTGSDDDSIKIAKEHGAKVFTDYKWNDHFSEARNESKKHCTGDWLLIIDGDEILESSIPAIRELIAKPFIKDKNIIMFDVNTGMEVNVQPRLFRNRPDIQWVGAAHNKLCYVRPGQPPVSIGASDDMYKSAFKIKANFSPNHRVDPDRTLRIMSKELAQGEAVIGRDQYTRYLYYVSREWLNRQSPIQALYFLSEYVKIAPPTNELADAHFMMATCYQNLGRLMDAVRAYLECIVILPSYKAAWAGLHNLGAPQTQKYWERMFHMADNDNVLFIRQEAEKLWKPEDKSKATKKPKKK